MLNQVQHDDLKNRQQKSHLPQDGFLNKQLNSKTYIV